MTPWDPWQGFGLLRIKGLKGLNMFALTGSLENKIAFRFVDLKLYYITLRQIQIK